VNCSEKLSVNSAKVYNGEIPDLDPYNGPKSDEIIKHMIASLKGVISFWRGCPSAVFNGLDDIQ